MDIVSKRKRSEMMSNIRGKNTGPELLVRKYLTGKGVGYRLHKRNLPGSPDIVNERKKFIIQVRGCFWHAHNCKLFRLPKTNKKFWKTKLSLNKARDKKNDKRIRKMGYRLLCVPECKIRNGKYKSMLSKFL
jgi:DNA mismatch endonuclease (patch repair protein)